MTNSKFIVPFGTVHFHWKCNCGQFNAAYRDKCLNCDMSRLGKDVMKGRYARK